ncbi:MAG: AAA family ATPase [Clostridia bacterium]|nr:AAA family ATPase [Clostridia bacterium]
MIDKLLAVKNVGIFDNLRIDTDTWNKEFKKLNLIYAENGQGKTTLSVIFQSIKKGKPELLIGRKTLGVTGEQKIKLISGNRQIIFENNAWNELIPDIEIFNSRFITENVYVGDTINAEQKRNLHQYVLGEEGVSLVQQINELDGKIRPINNEIQVSVK